MFASVPLMAVSFILYNLVVFGFGAAGGNPLQGEVFSMGMMSGGRFTLNMGDGLILASLILLFFEILKSTRTSNASVVDHLLSTGVFILFLVEFLLVPSAATAVFFIIMVMALIDVMAGFSVSIRSSGRDINYN
jgi:hypothetical protein